MLAGRVLAAKRAFTSCMASGDVMGEVGLELVDLPQDSIFGAARRAAGLEELMTKASRFRVGAPRIVLYDAIAHTQQTLGNIIDAEGAADLACIEALHSQYFIPESGDTHPCAFARDLRPDSFLGTQQYEEYASARKEACHGR